MNEAKQLPQAMLDECEHLALRLAPELSASPLYFVNVPADHPRNSDCAAFTTRGANNFVIRESLISAGRWQGAGNIVAFCDSFDRRTVLSLAIHETAHLLPYQTPFPDVEPSPVLIDMQRQFISGVLSSPEPDRQPWYAHGLEFIRCCLHLHRRAWNIGLDIGAGDIQFAGFQYGLSHHSRYLNTIGDEPRRMVGESFKTIIAEPFPEPFLELWRNDVVRWYRDNPPAKQQQEISDVRDCA